jgi:MFS family permease
MDTITAKDTVSTQKPGLFINRNFALLWTGGTISVFGDNFFDTSLVVWISVSLAAQQTWAPLAVSGVLLAMLIPTFVFGPIAGVFVDRWDKRSTMLWADAIRTVLVALLLLATNTIPLPFLPNGRVPVTWQLGMIYAVVFLSSLCTQFFTPSRMALIASIVPEPYRARASGMTQMTHSLSMLIAPPLAPILFLLVGAPLALLLNTLSFAGSFLCLLAMRTPNTASSQASGGIVNFLREFRAGLSFSFRNRVLSTQIITVCLIMFGASAINALDIFFIQNNLHAPVELFGFLSTAQGIGAIAGAIVAGMLAQRVGLVRTINLSLLAAGLGLLVYSRLTNFALAVIAIVLVGFFATTLNVAIGPLLMRVTPRNYLGRVMATINPLSAIAQVLGTIIAGYLASDVLLNLHVETLGMTFGPIDTLFTAGALLILLGTIYAFLRLGFTDPEPVEEAMQVPVTAEEAQG